MQIIKTNLTEEEVLIIDLDIMGHIVKKNN